VGPSVSASAARFAHGHGPPSVSGGSGGSSPIVHLMATPQQLPE
jgi:hypothetical protein